MYRRLFYCAVVMNVFIAALLYTTLRGLETTQTRLTKVEKRVDHWFPDEQTVRDLKGACKYQAKQTLK